MNPTLEQLGQTALDAIYEQRKVSDSEVGKMIQDVGDLPEEARGTALKVVEMMVGMEAVTSAVVELAMTSINRKVAVDAYIKQRSLEEGQ